MILKQVIPIDNWWAIFKKENGDLGVNRLACLVMISDVGEIMWLECWNT
jgi:hypothetical protein